MRVRASAILASVAVVTALLAAPAASGAAAPVQSLGSGALIGAQIDPTSAPAFCDRLREDGSRAATVFLTRNVIERNDGSLNTTAIDNRVEPDRACGIEPAVRVRPTTAPDQDSYLPAGAELDGYLSLLTELAQYLNGRVNRYAIDNEAAAQTHFDGTAAEYFELVRRSAAALRAGDPDAEILDGTMASGNMSAVMVADLYGQGRYGEAIALAQQTQANELGGGPPVTDMASLTSYVNDARVQRSIDFFAAAVANQDAFEAFQLHYYGPWRGLADMVEYARAHGITRPIEIWEVAHRYLDGRPFIEEDFAAETARLVISAAGEGSAFTVFSSYLGNEDNDAIGLIGFDGTTPHLARAAFRTVTTELSGAIAAQRLPVGGDAWGYLFERPGAAAVSAAWSDPSALAIGRELGIDATTALVTTAGGTPAHVRLSKLRIGPTPVFAEPDLVELERLGKRSRKQLTLTLSCPIVSPQPFCKGRVKVRRAPRKAGKGVRRGKSKKPQVLGKQRFSVAAGTSETLRVRFRRRGRPGEAEAKTKRCSVGGKGGCRSWLELR